MPLEHLGGMDNDIKDGVAQGGVSPSGVSQGGDTAARAARAADHDDPMIPGAREANTLTHREAGAISGQSSGADLHAQPSEWVDGKTATEHVREGGGADRARRMREATDKRRPTGG